MSKNDSAAENHLGYHLRRVSVLIMSELSLALKPLGLSVTEATLLGEIAANPGITQSALGKILDIKRANMSPLIAGLVKRGYVTAQPRDGRSNSVMLTAAGEAVTASAIALMDANDEVFFASLDKAEKQQLITRLRQLWHRHS
jgi:DNA-binding MarR family transcriptional regulator